MTKRCEYIAVNSQQRFDARSVLRVPASTKPDLPNHGSRKFIPFTGFDGQKLAGSGALVWEGELLQERSH